MAVSCPEVMYGAYYPYLYGRGARYHPPAPFYERPRAKSEAPRDDDEPEPEGARAHYLSANCVVFTHYSGDVAAVVDEHFARALAQDKPKESIPMVSRNLPASFFNALAGGGGGVELYEYDPWHQHYGGYAPQYPGYGPLLLPRHAQYKPVDWQHAHLDAAACASYAYPAVSGLYQNQASYQKRSLDEAFSKRQGLEAPVQDSSKDLYWF